MLVLGPTMLIVLLSVACTGPSSCSAQIAAWIQQELVCLTNSPASPRRKMQEQMSAPAAGFQSFVCILLLGVSLRPRLRQACCMRRPRGTSRTSRRAPAAAAILASVATVYPR